MDPRTVTAILRASLQGSGSDWRKQSLAKFGRTEEDPPPATIEPHPSRYLRDGRRCEIWFETCKIDVAPSPPSNPTDPDNEDPIPHPSTSDESDADKKYLTSIDSLIHPNGVIRDL